MIEFRNINFRYAGGTDAGGLANINLIIPDGQVILLCGQSGCGKTTLTRLVNGLIPNYYEGKLSGEVLLDGKNISRLPLYETAKYVGSVFQNPRTQFFTVDSTSELAFGCENQGLPEEEIIQRVKSTAEQFDMENLLGKNIFSLSGGEKQKIACASVSASNPPIIVLDEPSSNLDMSATKDLRRMRRLICFDMDSTLIETEVIDELAIRAGVGDQVKAITERAMRGEIDFIESFRERVALLKGLDESVMQEIAENLPITEGVDRLMYVLKKYGYKIAILSGGFTYFGQYLQKKYGIDYVYANELEIEDGKLTGRYLGDVVDGKRKAELLRLIAQVEKVDIAQTIAVGDGANDLPMLGIAGLGIAFHAKPKVVANAKQSINTIGLDGVLYFLGFKDSYIDIPR